MNNPVKDARRDFQEKTTEIEPETLKLETRNLEPETRNSDGLRFRPKVINYRGRMLGRFQPRPGLLHFSLSIDQVSDTFGDGRIF